MVRIPRGLHTSQTIPSSKTSVNFRILEPEVTGYSHGQTDAVIFAQIGDRPIGYLQYAEFRGKPHILHIAVNEKFRHQGIARAMVAKLAGEYGYENIDWGMTTDDGTPLKATLDNEYGLG